MLKSFSYSGNWNLPGSPKKLNGTLIYDSVEGARLDVFGSFDKVELDPCSAEIVLGDTSNGLITLLDCYFIRRRRTEELIESSYTISLILVGKHFVTKDEIQFDEVYFETFNLFEWINIRSLRMNDDFHDQGILNIHYKRPQEISFIFNDHCTGRIVFSCIWSHIDNPHQINTRETCNVHLKFNELISYSNIITEVTIFNQFISLCTFEQSYPTSLIFITPNIPGNLHNKANNEASLIHCHFKNFYFKPDYKLRRTDEHILTFAAIENDFSSIFSRWYKYYRHAEPSFILLLRFFQDKFTASTAKFLDQARAIETFHRRTENNRSYIKSKQEYKLLLNTIVDNDKLTKEEKEWVRNKLSYGNEPTFAERLTDILYKMNDNPIVKKFIPDPKIFIKHVVNNRNFYTHFSRKSNWSPKEGLELQILADKVMLLLICAIFNLMEIPHENYADRLKTKFIGRII